MPQWPKKQNLKQLQYCNTFKKDFKNAHLKKSLKSKGVNNSNSPHEISMRIKLANACTLPFAYAWHLRNTE